MDAALRPWLSCDLERYWLGSCACSMPDDP
jgi:hypothetical protein